MSADRKNGADDPRGESEVAPARPARSTLFRDEALRHHVRAREFGDVVRLPPRWTRFAFPVVVVIALAGVVVLGAGRATLDARGPAVVRSADDSGARFTVQAFLPARFLPDLKPGLPLRVEPAGYPGTRVEVALEQAGTRPLTPAEARRLLGAAANTPTPEIAGDVVEVRASIAGTAFLADDGEHPWVDGMAASAETPVRSEPLIYSLFPGLRAAISD